MTDNVFYLPGSKPREEATTQAPPAPKVSFGNPGRIEAMHDMIDDCSIDLGDAFSVGVTKDNRIVVLYGSNDAHPEHLRGTVMENRPMQAWEHGVMSTLFGLLAAHEKHSVPPAEEPPEPDQYVTARFNVQCAITQRLAMDQTLLSWPVTFRHDQAHYIGQTRDVPIAAHAPVFAVNVGTDSERAVAWQIGKTFSGSVQLMLTFIQRTNIGGMSRSLAAISRNYDASAYLDLHAHDVITSQTIAGKFCDDGYQEMRDITYFLATGEIETSSKIL